MLTSPEQPEETRHMAKNDFDIGIIGGGPAGSTAASYLAAAGLNVVVLESEQFPRPHIGESLVPTTTPVLEQIGALEKVDRAGFPRKYGAAWTSAAAKSIPKLGFTGMSHDFNFSSVGFRERKQAGVHQPYTYHVDRGKFDQLLLDHAASLGAEVWQGVRVQAVDLKHGGSLIRTRSESATAAVQVGMVVDASGRQTFLGRHLKLKQADPVFNQYAVHAWFRDLDRTSIAKMGGMGGQEDYIFIHHLPIPDSWIWQIPITDDITSIGIVTRKERLRAAGGNHEVFFWECVDTRPELKDVLRAAERVRPFKTEGDYSYGMKEIVGDGWALVGDAARFVDPIFSSGVSIAMNGARLLSADLIAATQAGDFSKERFNGYVTTLRRGVRNWYTFITMYYRLNVLFSAFVQDPRYRLDVLKLLQGEVYDELEPEVLTLMREVVTEVENKPDHLWHRHLGTVGSTVIKPAF
jgi:FADH2 O2-dependent halogenase